VGSSSPRHSGQWTEDDRAPLCLDGRCATPPESCGGPTEGAG
jgi:hypothetical protein